MISIAIVALISGILFVSFRTRLNSQKFLSDAARLSARLEMLQRIAVNTQVDWRGQLTREKGKWVLKTENADGESGRSLQLGQFQLFLEGKEVEVLKFEFYSSGEMRPSRSVKLQHEKLEKELTLTGRMEGFGNGRGAPRHPAEILAK